MAGSALEYDLKSKEVISLVKGERKFIRPNADSTDWEIDEEKRTVTFPVSSEIEVERWYGVEILDHSKGAVNLSRFKDGAPLLWNHDTDRQIGVIEGTRLIEERIFVTVRFSRSAFAEEKFRDVIDRIIRNVSLRYHIDEIVLDDDEKDRDVYRVKKWTPLEASLAPVPADQSVGLRSINEQTKSNINQLISKRREETPMDGATTEPVSRVEVGINNSDEIFKLAERFDAKNEALSAISRNITAQEFAKELVDARSKETKPMQTYSREEVGLTKEEARSFSLHKAIVAVATGSWSNAGFERSVCEAARAQFNKAENGNLFIPVDMLRASADPLDSTNASALVATDFRSQSFIDELVNKLILSKLGATTLNSLVGTVEVPRQTDGLTAHWVGEGTPIEVSTATFDQVTLSPKTVSCHTAYSKKLLAQNTLDVERLLRNDLTRRLAIALDVAAFSGSGKNQPKGILTSATGSDATITHVTKAALDWKEVVALEGRINSSNADVDTMSYVTNPKIVTKMKTTEKAPNTAHFIWGDTQMAKTGLVNGYNAYSSNQIPITGSGASAVSSLILGVWSEVIIGSWGLLEVVVDNFTLAHENRVRIVSTQEVDIVRRHEESFSVINGIKTGS